MMSGSRDAPRGCLLMLACGLLAGCAVTEQSAEAPQPCPVIAQPRPVHVVEVPCGADNREAREAASLGLMVVEVAALSREGKPALRDALANAQDEPLRGALLLLALGEVDGENRALELLEHVLDGGRQEAEERLVAAFVRDQILARRALRSGLSEARSERDALQQQLEELKAIERQIRDRDRTPEVELNDGS